MFFGHVQIVINNRLIHLIELYEIKSYMINDLHTYLKNTIFAD